MDYAAPHSRRSPAAPFARNAPKMPSAQDALPTPEALRHALRGTTLAGLFAADPDRYARLSLAWDGWRVDLSKERVTPEVIAALVREAERASLPAWIAALFAGEKVNQSEGRPALHMALRQQDDTPIHVDGQDIIPAVRAAQARIAALADALRDGSRIGATGRPIRDVVHIGIGGSDLGPRLVCDALGAIPAAGENPPGVRFVSNVDPEHLTRALHGLEPQTTLFVVVSKTFTTQETLANAAAARDWLRSALPPGSAAGAHFVGVSSNIAAARAFGIADADILPMWDWVGGRYSLWSAVGLPIAIRLGPARFAELLAGAASVDRHFRATPLERNLPVLLGLVGWWNARMLGHAERVVVPYAHALGLLPAFLQQLVLESNGKCVRRGGEPLTQPFCAALWGMTGTDGQHAFFQWLHQGLREAPVEFIVPLRAAHPRGRQQTLLVANALAQAQALFAGRSADTVRAELAAKGLEAHALDAAIAARTCPGDRASTMILLPELDARRLGQLLALYEHRTFVEAVLAGINPFDQYGVELGKTLAAPIIAALTDGTPLPEGIDPSTRGLVAQVRTELGAA
jgi:glucose-6-phosphate isomerase